MAIAAAAGLAAADPCVMAAVMIGLPKTAPAS
jgi:hypothetical protein